jgi:hypothetical protein
MKLGPPIADPPLMLQFFAPFPSQNAQRPNVANLPHPGKTSEAGLELAALRSKRPQIAPADDESAVSLTPIVLSNTSRI